MSLLSHTPTFTADDAEAIARAYYGVRAVAHRLPGERDQNFRLDLDGVPTYVLKVANSAESLDVLAAQHGAAALALTSGLPVQRVEPTLAGADHVEHKGHIVRLLDWLPGVPLASHVPYSRDLLRSLGAALGRLTRALDGYDHPAAHRDFHWDVARADVIVGELREAVTDPERRASVDEFLDRFRTGTAPKLADLRRAVIHGDANDLNVLVDSGNSVGSVGSVGSGDTGERGGPLDRQPRVSGLLDFGDLVHSVVVAEPAVAAAYVMHRSDDPLTSVAHLVAGFHEEYQLTEPELEVLWDLVRARQVLSVCNAAVQGPARPGDPYLTLSEGPAWAALKAMREINPRLAHYRLRDACGLEPHPGAEAVRRHLASSTPAPLLRTPWAELRTFDVDLSLGSETVSAAEASAPPDRFDGLIRTVVDGDQQAIGIGGYGEQRLIYTGPEYETAHDVEAERRSVHLAVDVWASAGTAVCAPLPGTVVVARNNGARLDYGPVVILEHTADAGRRFYSLYGHLSLSTLEHVAIGQAVAAGETIGWVGTPPSNGDWAPHVHVQVILDLLDLAHDFPGVGLPSQRSMWLGLSPDPVLLLHLPMRSVMSGEL